MTKQSLRLLWISAVFLAILSAPAVTPAENLPIITIGIVNDGTALGFSGYIEEVKAEIDKLTAADYDIRYTETKPVDSVKNGEAVEQEIERLMKDPDVDLVIALGVLASHALISRQSFPKPAAATVVIDPEIQKLPRNGNSSGRRNLTYIQTERDLTAEIRELRRLVPFRKAVVIEDQVVDRGVATLKDRFLNPGEEMEAEFVFIPSGDLAESVLERIPVDADAVIVTPFLRLSDTEAGRLIEGLTMRGLPAFSLWGEKWVKAGLLAGVCPDANTDRVVRRTALNVLQIIQGSDPASLPVDVSVSEQLMINMATARKLNIAVGWELRTGAMLFADNDESRDGIGLLDAVRAALANNLELASENRRVQAGEEDVRQSLAQLLPQFSLSSTATMVDEDRARASFGLFTEERWSGTASVSQVLYSDAAVTGYRVQKDLQESRRAANDALRLDIGTQTAIAYFDALSASVLVQIRKNNLGLTRANLRRAENRRQIGMANPAEVYRWQSKIATDKKDLLVAEARLAQAIILLNRNMATPAQTRLALMDIPPDAPLFINFVHQIFDRLDNPERLRFFEQFIASQAVDRSPEIRQLEAAIAAAEKRLGATRRARWLPTVFFQGGYTRYFAEGGAGTDPVPPQFPVFDISTGQPQPTSMIVPFPDLSTDDAEWHLAVNAVLNLYNGGAISSEYRQANEEWHRWKLRYRDAADRIRAGVGAVVQSAGASYPGIELSRDAADAADQNLDLVADAYERGVISIVDLLEAQNAAITANQGAATAEYEFLKDMVRLQRAAGRISYEISPEEAEAFRKELEQYFETTGMVVVPVL